MHVRAQCTLNLVLCAAGAAFPGSVPAILLRMLMLAHLHICARQVHTHLGFVSCQWCLPYICSILLRMLMLAHLHICACPVHILTLVLCAASAAFPGSVPAILLRILMLVHWLWRWAAGGEGALRAFSAKSSASCFSISCDVIAETACCVRCEHVAPTKQVQLAREMGQPSKLSHVDLMQAYGCYKAITSNWRWHGP